MTQPSPARLAYVAYVAGWSKALRADKQLVIAAASQGQKAAGHITGN